MVSPGDSIAAGKRNNPKAVDHTSKTFCCMLFSYCKWVRATFPQVNEGPTLDDYSTLLFYTQYFALKVGFKPTILGTETAAMYFPTVSISRSILQESVYQFRHLRC